MDDDVAGREPGLPKRSVSGPVGSATGAEAMNFVIVDDCDVCDPVTAIPSDVDPFLEVDANLVGIEAGEVGAGPADPVEGGVEESAGGLLVPREVRENPRLEGAHGGGELKGNALSRRQPEAVTTRLNAHPGGAAASEDGLGSRRGGHTHTPSAGSSAVSSVARR